MPRTSERRDYYHRHVFAIGRRPAKLTDRVWTMEELVELMEKVTAPEPQSN